MTAMERTRARSRTAGGFRRLATSAKAATTASLLLGSIMAASAGPHDHAEAEGAACATLPDRSVMFEPGVAPERIEQIVAAARRGMIDFETVQPLAATATNGAVQPGQALTITYSFVPDGTFIQGFNGEPGSPSNLFATTNASFPGGANGFRQKVAEAFQRWGAITNITYVEVADDGATFQSSPGLLAGGGAVGRGDVRIAMHPVGDGPLAYNFFPQFGSDMVIDSLDIAVFADPTDNFVSLHNTLTHEHGHGIGLQHVIPTAGTKLMEPFLNTGFAGPQEDDIRAVHFLYGDPHEANNTLQTSAFVGGPLNNPGTNGVVTLGVEGVSLERAGESDFYSFTSFAGAPIAIRVEPIGTTYQQGPQGGTPAALNARSVRNLGLRLWRRISAQANTFELFAQIDFNAAGEAEYHPPLAYSVAGFMVAEVFSTDGVNAPQRYNLTISNSDIGAPQGIPKLQVADGLTLVSDGSTLLFGATQVGQSSGKALLVSNVGEGALLFTGSPERVTIAGPGAADFSVGDVPVELAAGASAVLGITFQPTAVGQRTAVIGIQSNDPDFPNFSFIVSGTAVQPQVGELEVRFAGSVVPHDGQIALGELVIGETSQFTLDLRNKGNASLNLPNTLGITGPAAADYAKVSGLPANLQPNQSASLVMRITPSAAGTRAATLQINNNGVQPAFRVNVAAIAADPIVDCNGNGTDDALEIALGSSPDCDGNGVPDDCQPDSDGDGLIDACDACPNDPAKFVPGACGCGVPETDSDNDGKPDCDDAFPLDPTNGGAGNGGGNNGNTGAGAEEEDLDDEDLDLFPVVAPCGLGLAFTPMLLALVSLKGANRRRYRFSR